MNESNEPHTERTRLDRLSPALRREYVLALGLVALCAVADFGLATQAAYAPHVLTASALESLRRGDLATPCAFGLPSAVRASVGRLGEPEVGARLRSYFGHAECSTGCWRRTDLGLGDFFRRGPAELDVTCELDGQVANLRLVARWSARSHAWRLHAIAGWSELMRSPSGRTARDATPPSAQRSTAGGRG